MKPQYGDRVARKYCMEQSLCHAYTCTASYIIRTTMYSTNFLQLASNLRLLRIYIFTRGPKLSRTPVLTAKIGPARPILVADRFFYYRTLLLLYYMG